MGVNPRIVCCSLSGFGMTGPRAAEAGYDYMMQGLAGWMSLTGPPDAPPTKSGLSLVDLSGGYVSAIAVLAGLLRARRDGVGCDCDVSLFETALAELVYVGTWAATSGYTPPRRHDSAHPSIVPFQNFATADGWIVVACPKQKFWELLCDAIGRPELVADERFADLASRDLNRDALLPMLEETFRTRTSGEWLAVLAEAGVPSAAVNDVADALAEPQAEARGDVVEVEHPRLGRVRQIASPLRLSGPDAPLRRAPFRGEHTEQVLVEVCGYEPERVRALADAGVFGDVVART
jgi:crotonobetainyl-CoA:carnitine CoA-transferase CaiB-like acyl-CoA transferase